MNTGERIKKRRKELGLSADDLAERLGISRSTVYRYESGFIEKLPMDFLEPLSKALQTTPAYIMGWKKEDNTKGTTPSPSEVDPDMFVLYMYKKLDTEDRAEIRGEMKQMLKSDKYSGDAPVPVTYLFSMPFYNIPVSAGTGEFLDSDDYEMLDLTDEPPRGANFIVRVSGDSMEPTYHDGDKLFIKQQPNIEVGEIGIFMIDGNVYVKEFDSDGLISHNYKYDKIKFTEFENIRCYGKVVGKVDE